MLKAVASWFLLICSLLLWVTVSATTTDNGFPRCNCDDESSLWTIESILECQRVGDFLIAVAYFSIPIELLYFISCTNVPFKWLMVALTVFKILTALVSCATAITLVTLIPMLLKVKVREFMLKKKTGSTPLMRLF